MATGNVLVGLVQRELRQGHSKRRVADRLKQRGFDVNEQRIRRIVDGDYRPRGAKAHVFARCKCHGWLVKGGVCLEGQLSGQA